MFRCLKREPQNIEYRMLNIEGKENIIIRNSLFDIRHSKWGNSMGLPRIKYLTPKDP